MAVRRRIGRANRRAIAAERHGIMAERRSIERARVRRTGRSRGPDAARRAAAVPRARTRLSPLGRRTTAPVAVGSAHAHSRREVRGLPPLHTKSKAGPAARHALRAARGQPAVKAAKAATRPRPAKAVRVGKARRR